MACVIVTLAFPPFVNVIGWELLLPVITLPKLALAGFAVNCACTPVPLIVTVAGDPGALLAIEMLPETAPVAVGKNFAVKDVLPPAAIVAGNVSPVTLNLAPVTVA